MSDKLKKHGLPEDYFDRADLEKGSNEKTHKLCKWIMENNKINPNIRSKDSKEKSLGHFLVARKGAAGGYLGSAYYPSDQLIVELYGLKNLFKITSSEKKSNDKVHKICKWIIKEKRHPSRAAKNKEENYLGVVLASKRASKRGVSSYILYPSDQAIVESYGLNDLFEKNSGEKRSNDKVHKLCKWIMENKRFPRQAATSAEEQSLGVFVSNRKKAKLGSLAMYYLSDQVIYESYGLKNLFETNTRKMKG